MRRMGVLVDLVAVAVFVGIGRSVHAHGSSVTGFFSTAWPFVTGLAVGWGALVICKRPSASIAGGISALISTVVFGMVLRVVSGQGTAFAFILVALGFLGAEMLGWRATIIAFQRRRPAIRIH